MSARTFHALGTASQVPTRERNHNGYFLRWDAEGFLFDPGEGTQRQMTFAGVSASEITKIFLTHFHGDHCLGLPGVLQRLSLDKVQHEIEVYYPASGRRYFENLKNSSIYHNQAKIVERPISEAGVIFENEFLTIKTAQLDHTAESWGYRIEEPDAVTMLPEKLAEFDIRGANVGKLKREGLLELEGKTILLEDVSVPKKGFGIAFVMDTRVCPAAFDLARDVDFLICESTYLASETEEAVNYGHLTATQAAQIALASNAKQLVLTHFSRRYPNTEDFAAEARRIFPNAVAARDGDRIDIKRKLIF